MLRLKDKISCQRLINDSTQSHSSIEKERLLASAYGFFPVWTCSFPHKANQEKKENQNRFYSKSLLEKKKTLPKITMFLLIVFLLQKK